MNSIRQQSSVIILDSDDEEDQSKSNSGGKPNLPISPNESASRNIRNAQNSITVIPTNQHTKTNIASTPIHVSNLGCNSNSVSIIPINSIQNQTKIFSNNNNQIQKNFQILKLSPKNSPQNSPKPKTLTLADVSRPKTPINSAVINLKSQETTTEKTLNKEATVIESSKNLNNNELTQAVNINMTGKPSLKRKASNETGQLDLTKPKPKNQKRIKPTLISPHVNPKWNKVSNTITIEDDDEIICDGYIERTSISKNVERQSKSRSNSITSSGAPSPSPSTSSISATSPPSRNSPNIHSPLLSKEVTNLSNKCKSTANSIAIIDQSVNKSIKDSGESKHNKISDLPNKVEVDGQNTSKSPFSNESLVEENKETKQKNEIIPAFAKLIEACKLSDKSHDMEILIEKKLLKYYHSIHPDFITSKSFRKTVENITAEILETPNLVYIKLKTIMEELKTRKNSKVVVVSNDGQTSTGNDEIDEKVRKLNKGLRKLKHIIAKLEEQEVDWDTDINSAYLKVERCKKRACEIYEKICDLTGESKHAQRTVRKPINFDHTPYPRVNKAIERFVNKTKTFPDYHDILTIIQHCNKMYKLELMSEEIKRLAQEAFVKVGKLLQNRRKTDLYETLSHYTEKIKDPALEDATLNAKLNENKKHYGKINAIIQKYAREQDTIQSEKTKAKENHKKQIINSDDDSSKEEKNLPSTSTELKRSEKLKSSEKEIDSQIISSTDTTKNDMINTTKINTENDTKKREKIKLSAEESHSVQSTNIEKISNANVENDSATLSARSNGNCTDPTSIANTLTTLKIKNLSSLMEKSYSQKQQTINLTPLSNLKSNMPSSTSSLNDLKKRNEKNMEIQEIVLSDDDV